MATRVIHEVDLDLDDAIEGEYRTWLDALAGFGGRFSASRRVLRALADYA